MDRHERNKQSAELCLSCIYLHIGQDVDHNHCDKVRGCDHWMDRRTNGSNTYDCRYKTKALKGKENGGV